MRCAIAMFFVLVMVIGFNPAGAPEASEGNAVIDLMFTPLHSYAWPETSISELDRSIKQFTPGQSENADRKRIRLANLYRELGRYDEAVSILLPLTVGVAATDDLRWAAKVLWGLTWATVHNQKGETKHAIAALVLGENAAGFVKAPRLRHYVLRMAQDYRLQMIFRLLPLAEVWDGQRSPNEEQRIPNEIVRILLGLLYPDLLYDIESREQRARRPIPTSPNAIQFLARNRPWKNALIRSAEVLAGELHDLDLAVFGPGDLVVALRRNRSANLLSARTRFNDAVAQRRSALALFRRQDRQDKVIEVLDGTTSDLMKIGTPEALVIAIFSFEELIQIHETRMARMGSRNIGRYQVLHRVSYTRYRQLLRRLNSMGTDNAARFDVARKLVLHTDRMRLRPVRREIVEYRAMIKAGFREKLVQALDASKRAIKDARNRLLKAHDERRARDDFQATSEKGIARILKEAPLDSTVRFEAAEPSKRKVLTFESGPYVELDVAKGKAKRAIATLGGPAIAAIGGNVELPSGWQELVSGIDSAEGIVTYMEFGLSEPLMAAVITSTGKPRIVELPGASLAEVQRMVRTAVDQLGANSLEAAHTIGKLAQVLWQPLGELPERLTIVPILSLLGLPFEAFPEGDGKLVIDTHTVRYSLGLGNGIGDHYGRETPRYAVIVGAHEFPQQNLDSLEESRKEVEALRRLLISHGIRVEPEDPFPKKGSAWLGQDNSLDILHISTHAVWDKEDPMFDMLAFPEENVLALELAQAPVRARLAVFSACNLFKQRASKVNPVSGITTATLATVAPQIITTLWSINPGVTRIFMQKFYERLLKTRDATTALAFAKRDFLNPARLRAWLKTKSISMPQGLTMNKIDKIATPYYWAPFVLVFDPSAHARSGKSVGR